jgi:hypothetical protein
MLDRQVGSGLLCSPVGSRARYDLAVTRMRYWKSNLISPGRRRSACWNFGLPYARNVSHFNVISFCVVKYARSNWDTSRPFRAEHEVDIFASSVVSRDQYVSYRIEI